MNPMFIEPTLKSIIIEVGKVEKQLSVLNKRLSEIAEYLGIPKEEPAQAASAEIQETSTPA